MPVPRLNQSLNFPSGKETIGLASLYQIKEGPLDPRHPRFLDSIGLKHLEEIYEQILTVARKLSKLSDKRTLFYSPNLTYDEKYDVFYDIKHVLQLIEDYIPSGFRTYNDYEQTLGLYLLIKRPLEYVRRAIYKVRHRGDQYAARNWRVSTHATSWTYELPKTERTENNRQARRPVSSPDCDWW